MKHRRRKKTRRKNASFTVVELMIVLVIAGLMLIAVFLIVPKVQSLRRDNERKSVIAQVLAALGEFRNNYLRIPACDDMVGSCPAAQTNALAFLSSYMPKSTLNDYNPGSTSAGWKEVHTDNDSVTYYYDASIVDHSRVPQTDQIFIVSGHWCYSTRPDDGPPTSPVASNALHPTPGTDVHLEKYAIVIGRENTGFFCIDNY